MAETLTIANFNITQHTPADLYAIGRTEQHPQGVIEEMATAFGHELTPSPTVENIGGLIARVGAAKELQENIQGVQQVLGTDKDAVTIAQGWVKRAGLLVPVARSYMTGEVLQPGQEIDMALFTTGVARWIDRRAKVVEQLHETNGIKEVVVGAGKRVMKASEKPGVVRDGMREVDYVEEVVAPKLRKEGIDVTVVYADSEKGDEVAAAAAVEVKRQLGGTAVGKLVVASNAGAWPQVGQLRCAHRDPNALGANFDQSGQQLYVVSDTIALGTGKEPPDKAQNPFSALGLVPRAGQEFLRQY